MTKALKQLDTLYKVELDREQKAAKALQDAEFDYQQNQQRMQSVSEYRLEYMKRLNQRSREGIDSLTYSHFHAFINKLDNASEQVKIAMLQAKALVKKRKDQWLAQRKKIQTVELLRNNKLQIIHKAEEKKEQVALDEMATQQFIRNKNR